MQNPQIEIIEVTPEMAQEWLDGHNHANRNIRARNVASMVRDIESGNFMFTGDSIKFDRNGRLIDGQHRLSAISRAGIPVRLVVARGVEFDVQKVLDAGVRRTAADALGFAGCRKYRTNVAALAKVDLAFRAGAIKKSNSRGAASISLTNSEIVGWWEEHPESEEACAMAVSVNEILGAPSLAGLSYAYMRFSEIDPDSAAEFMFSIAESRTTGKGDPRYTLLRFFARLDLLPGHVGTSTTVYALFKAWNSWRASAPLSQIQVTRNGEAHPIPDLI